jgi:hypothetical protein
MPPTADTQQQADSGVVAEAAPPRARRRDDLNGRFDYDDAAKNWKNQGEESQRKRAILLADKDARRKAQLGNQGSSDSSSGSEEDEYDFGKHRVEDETIKGYEEFGNRHKLDR